MIVKAVKAMQCSLLYGEQISAILKESQVSIRGYKNHNNWHDQNTGYYAEFELICFVYRFIGMATICTTKAWLVSYGQNKSWGADV